MTGEIETRIIALAKEGMAPAQIALEVDRQIATVYHYCCKARRNGEVIPKFRTGMGAGQRPTLMSVAPQTVSRLRPLAHERGQTVPEFCNELLAVIAQDDLAASVLDDGEPDA
ncbi:hypothetical protein LGQ03_04920 [Loktanella sp. TSTF-M6]|uniref:Homeodomain-like domain-containing protein n=1 Tax=Loktanella gaetbuli TaxID=2881335 RepID=A0ABS8BS51_9RHOB|nr:hypothetical protein [Loktanella gaetbuli]MCB5198573.1 hypothetical protein [Loktanella gaetbuli]